MRFRFSSRYVRLVSVPNPDSTKMKKQMSYANSKAIAFVAIIGENEMKEGKVTLKNMATGEQSLVSPEELIATVKA